MMKPRFIQLFGVRTTEDSYLNTKVVSRPTAGIDALSAIGSVGGPSRKAKPQTYLRTYDLYHQGENRTTYPNGHYFTITGTLNSEPGVSPFFNSVAYNKAVENLYEQIRGNVDLSIDLYQIRQTQATVVKLVKLVTKATETLRSIRRSHPRDWGSQWLEYVYGIKPTCQTVYELLHRKMQPDVIWYDLRARAKDGNRSVDYTTYLPGIIYTREEEQSERVEIRARYAMNQTVLTSLAGFSSLNPVSFAWEAMPYSFVVDWVYNVGGYLRSMESGLLYGQSFIDGYVTRSKRGRVTGAWNGSNTDPLTKVVRSINSVGYSRQTYKTRSPISQTPFPDVPKFRVQLGSTRLLNAAALLSQFLK